MTKRGETLSDESDEAELSGTIEDPVMNSLRFTMMRLVRLLCTLVCEAVTLAGAVAFGVYGFFTACWAGAFVLAVVAALGCLASGESPEWLNFYSREMVRDPNKTYSAWRFFIEQPYILAIPSFFVMVIAWGQALSFGVPYRWENMPPGNGTVRCSECKAEIPHAIRCPRCRAFRVESHLGLKALWATNACITTVWVAHDALAALVGFAPRP